MPTPTPKTPLGAKGLAKARRKMSAAGKRSLTRGLKRAAAEGWLDQIKEPQDAHAIAAGCYFDDRFADHAQQFFEQGLVHQTGKFKGKPFTLLDWQCDGLIRPLFGWRDADGIRRFQSLFLFISKKNGKTTLGAGVLLYCLVAEPDPDNHSRPEPAQECYIASTSEKTGRTAFQEASKLMKGCPALATRCKALATTGRITYPAESSFLQLISSKAESAEGMIAGAVLFDEVHAMKSRKLYGALRYASASRRQPLWMETTTAGVIDPDALWCHRKSYSERVRDGDVVDIHHMPRIYEAPADAALDDEKALLAANPSAGSTGFTVAKLVKTAKAALAEGPAAQAEFRRYRMNIGVGAENGWINPESWKACQKPFDVAKLAGRECYAGLDLAKVSDFTSLALVWPGNDEDPTWYLKIWHWLPRAQVIARSHKGDESFASWEKLGLIRVTDGDTTDHTIVRGDLKKIAAQFNPVKIGVDRGFDGWQFTEDLFHDDDLPAVGVGQGWRSQDVPMQQLQVLITDRLLNAGDDPVAAWMFGNAIARKVGPNENLHLDKPQGSAKVDGVAASINAMFCALVVPDEEDNGSKHPTYDFNPLVIL